MMSIVESKQDQVSLKIKNYLSAEFSGYWSSRSNASDMGVIKQAITSAIEATISKIIFIRSGG